MSKKMTKRSELKGRQYTLFSRIVSYIRNTPNKTMSTICFQRFCHFQPVLSFSTTLPPLAQKLLLLREGSIYLSARKVYQYAGKGLPNPTPPPPADFGFGTRGVGEVGGQRAAGDVIESQIPPPTIFPSPPATRSRTKSLSFSLNVGGSNFSNSPPDRAPERQFAITSQREGAGKDPQPDVGLPER